MGREADPGPSWPRLKIRRFFALRVRRPDSLRDSPANHPSLELPGVLPAARLPFPTSTAGGRGTESRAPGSPFGG